MSLPSDQPSFFTRLRVTHEWTGTTSTTPDKYPVIGLMKLNT
jgi:glycine/D-amino acid oxidase-like deaminating enzyme